MDMTSTIIPKSDQINADDLMSGPITVTVKEVRKGSLEQPADVILEEFPGRAYRPSKSMRRVLVNAWGKESSFYAGRKLTLYRNPEIKFGAEKVGGVEISHMSHIDEATSVALTTTRGKRKNFTVQPLKAESSKPQRDWLAELTTANGNPDAIGSLGTAARAAGAGDTIMAAITDAYNKAVGV